MYKWGHRSLSIHRTLDPRLQDVLDMLLKYVDISLTSGHRNAEEQNALFEVGATKARWPDSKHNKLPSLAVDVSPYPYPMKEVELWAALGYIAGLAIGIADSQGVVLRWGGDWNQNGSVVDNNFDDLFHLEIVEC